MNKAIIVFESSRPWHYWLIKIYIKCGFRVWVVEPFNTYHHKKVIRFFPGQLPGNILELVRRGEVNLLSAEDMGSREMYFLAADRAVENTEAVYPEYKKSHQRIIGYTITALGSLKAEDIFKKELCDNLAVFYSINIMLQKIAEKFPYDRITVYTDTNILAYLYFKKLHKNTKHLINRHQNVGFSVIACADSWYRLLKDNVVAFAKLFIQLAGSLVLGWKDRLATPERTENYKYGITIINPARQLSENKRGPDFIVDNRKIHKAEVVYFPLARLNQSQEKRLLESGAKVCYLPDRKRQNFSRFSSWLTIFFMACRRELFSSTSVVTTTHLVFSEVFRWQTAMHGIKIRHLITHADFGFLHIPRNIFLNQQGTKTWYFTDSINYPLNLQDDKKRFMFRHPLWCYLNYDIFVTWEKSLVEYFALHPGSNMQSHVVGCLWADHIDNNRINEKNKNGKFIIAVFDTTYSCNSITSYTEGIAFAQHILKLAEEFTDEIEIIFKEKKERYAHAFLDASLGYRLLKLYDDMNTRKNIKICHDGADSATIISGADLTVSFPFTSTTFEALSANRPAIWHDPMGEYKHTPYGKITCLTTHNYIELKDRVIELKKQADGRHQDPIPVNSIFMDPYRDQRAIERFKDLLVKE